AGLRIHLRHVVFVGPVMLSGRDQHGVLHGVQHDLWIDALFLAQYLDGLKDRFQSALDVAMSFSFAAGITTRTSGWPSALVREESGRSSQPPFPARSRYPHTRQVCLQNCAAPRRHPAV